MSNKRYLEFDSTYRNRNCYPCPAEFITHVTCVKEDNNGLTANDYVAKEYPTESWYQVSYAGADATDLFNKEYVLPGINFDLSDNTVEIPMVINAKSYASLWPVDWMNGASPTYFSNLRNPQSVSGAVAPFGPIKIGSGAASKSTWVASGANVGHYISMGTRFQGAITDGLPGNQLNSPNNTFSKEQFWTSTAIRNKNILAPEKFSGGTASAPQLGPKALAQGLTKNYFTGAMVFRFRHNPLYDFNTVEGGAATGPAAATGAIGAGLADDQQATPLTSPNSLNGPLLGSLGFPYFYQTLTFAIPPPKTVKVGDMITGTNVTPNTVYGFIACVISQQEIIIRLGQSVPIGGGTANNVTVTGEAYPQAPIGSQARNLFPGVPPNLQIGSSTTGNQIDFTASVSLAEYDDTNNNVWGVPSSGTDSYPAYFWCGYVESAIITSYDQNTGIVTLDTPFTNSGTNGFNTSNDFYLLDFNSDPSGHWDTSSNPYTNINSGKPRVFFPGGAFIPNYYSGREITSATREEISGPEYALQDVKVSSYDVNRRTLFLEKSIVPTSPSYRGISVCSQYTLVFLKNSLQRALPIGTTISWNGNIPAADGGDFTTPTSGAINNDPDTTAPYAPVPWNGNGFQSVPAGPPGVESIPGQYFVAIDAPSGAKCIVLQGARDPRHALTPNVPLTTSILNMLGGPTAGGPLNGNATPSPYEFCGSVSVPPWASEDVRDWWRDPTHWSELQPDPEYPLNIASLLGAQTILVRGKVPVPQSNNLVPYIPMSSMSVPGNCPATVRENGVIELQIIKGGNSYKITDPTMPLMALLAVPTGNNPWNPPWPNMQPYPENFADVNGNIVYTFLNICFVNIKSVGAGGEILELEINSPGNDYPRGSRVFIIDGTGADVSKYDAQAANPVQWVPGAGNGAIATIVSTGQYIGIAGGEKYPLNGVPKSGDLLYMVSYGWGLPASEKTLYNSAPDIGMFLPNYSGVLGSEYVIEESDIPRKLQDCLDENSTYPETGTRNILHSMRSINNQILITPSITPWLPGGVGTTYQTLQYAAPGAYLGGISGINTTGLFGRFHNNLQNSVLWIAIENGFNLSLFKNQFGFSRDGYVNGNYTFAMRTPNLALPDLGLVLTAPLIPQGIPDQTLGTMQWSDARDAPMGQNNPLPVGYIQGGLQLSNSITGNFIQLLTFDRDNEHPLNYTGSTVSQNQMVCYEVELISLILPNLALDNTIGGLIAFYPYLYVELSNQTAPSSGIKGILYSNNPNANKALFRVAIDDTPTPIISKFIKVDGDGAVQTIKFKPNDNLYIRVYLQNGTLFKTQQNDTAPPSPPDPFVQISAEFSIKRLS